MRWLSNQRDIWEPEDDEATDVEEIGEVRNRMPHLSTRGLHEYDKTWGITATYKQRQFETNMDMRKLRVLVQDKEGHELLRRFVRRTRRLHLNTTGFDNETGRLRSRGGNPHRGRRGNNRERARDRLHARDTSMNRMSRRGRNITEAFEERIRGMEILEGRQILPDINTPINDHG